MAYNIPAAEPTPEELARECSGAADNAVEWIRSMSGIDLDFSPPSLMAVDRILNELVNTLPDEDKEATVVLLGSYLGEVLLRAAGGRWETGDVFTGPGVRGLGGKEITINPFARIRQAFADKEEHHLAQYWNMVVGRIEDSEELREQHGFRPPPSTPLKKLPVDTSGSGKKSEGPTDDELARIIPEETKKFIELLKADLGVELDYSINSLKFLDHYFRSLNAKMAKEGKMGEKRVFVYLAGNYLGEVLRREFGGRWVFIPEHQTTGLVLEMSDDENRTVYPHKAAAKMAMEYKAGAVVAYVDSIKRRVTT